MSDYAYEIVDAIYAGDKATALDAVADALKAKAVDAIQTKRIEVAQSWFSGSTEEEE
jgi:hypothetical protein